MPRASTAMPAASVPSTTGTSRRAWRSRARSDGDNRQPQRGEMSSEARIVAQDVPPPVNTHQRHVVVVLLDRTLEIVERAIDIAQGPRNERDEVRRCPLVPEQIAQDGLRGIAGAGEGMEQGEQSYEQP